MVSHLSPSASAGRLGPGRSLKLDAEMLDAFLGLIPDAAVAVDSSGSVVAVNGRALDMFAYPPGALEHKPIETLLPERFRRAHRRDRTEYAENPHARPMGAGLDLYARRADGSELPVDVSLAPVEGEEGLLVVAAVRDMTERKAVEKRLAVAADRERIARDLHDLVIQRLFGAGLRLQGALALIDSDAVATRVASTVEDLDTTIKEIREAIFALEAPPGIALRARVRDTLTDAAEALGFEPLLSFQAPSGLVIDPMSEAEAIAVLREALSNAARHAHASRVEVDVRVGDELIVRVVDNGVGIGKPRRRSGLANASARAELLGGRLDTGEAPGGGTLFEWRIPLPAR